MKSFRISFCCYDYFLHIDSDIFLNHYICSSFPEIDDEGSAAEAFARALANEEDSRVLVSASSGEDFVHERDVDKTSNPSMSKPRDGNVLSVVRNPNSAGIAEGTLRVRPHVDRLYWTDTDLLSKPRDVVLVPRIFTESSCPSDDESNSLPISRVQLRCSIRILDFLDSLGAEPGSILNIAQRRRLMHSRESFSASSHHAVPQFLASRHARQDSPSSFDEGETVVENSSSRESEPSLVCCSESDGVKSKSKDAEDISESSLHESKGVMYTSSHSSQETYDIVDLVDSENLLIGPHRPLLIEFDCPCEEMSFVEVRHSFVSIFFLRSR